MSDVPDRGPVAASKFLAYVLRHDPTAIGVSLDPAGWVELTTLDAALAAHGHRIDQSTWDHLLVGPGKRRFELADGRIRAAQGHSLPVDLGLADAVPPAVLFHGTVDRFLARIRVEGLRPMRRTHVHLSVDVPTAATVGARRGAPVVLRIDAAAMQDAGHRFSRAANGVWLTAHVPPTYLDTVTP